MPILEYIYCSFLLVVYPYLLRQFPAFAETELSNYFLQQALDTGCIAYP